jgi:NAD(P)H-nitrite reductase large subunit
MEQNLNQDILDKLTKVCICKGISRATIKAAIKNGADTLQAVQKATGAGSGSCGGRRCTPKIQELIK